ncbi:Putative Polycomb group protein ASXL2 [Anas platyrhynchos]|uniref:Putative Polycomb group protein ASXL2 n=1 Tax=Anas platyrhynchos TaxID=8839 RepID=R0L124_ANAPL|nr:Putative Polycomb group protein ASXL2 [Anas platyrhynchos]
MASWSKTWGFECSFLTFGVPVEYPTSGSSPVPQVLEKYPNTPMSHKEILQVIQKEGLKEIRHLHEQEELPSMATTLPKTGMQRSVLVVTESSKQ